MSRSPLLIALGMALLLTGGAAGAQAPPAETGGAAPAPPPAALHLQAQIESIAPDQSSLVVSLIEPGVEPAARSQPTLAVEDKTVRATLATFQPLDQVEIEEQPVGILAAVHIRRVGLSVLRRLAAMASSLLLLLLVCKLFVGRGPLLRRLLVGEDNRYSKSKVQVVIWFGAVSVAYLSTVWFRMRLGDPWLIGGVDVPQNLLILSGISALSFVAAKGITSNAQSRADAAATAAAAGNPAPAGSPPPPPKRRAAAPAFFSDLVNDDAGNPDIGDFQVVLVTLLAVVLFLVQTFAFLQVVELRAAVSIPDVDPTLLAIFGLGHATYVAKKAVS